MVLGYMTYIIFTIVKDYSILLLIMCMCMSLHGAEAGGIDVVAGNPSWGLQKSSKCS